MEYYISELQAYLKQLCIKNVEVLHNDDSNVAYIRFHSNEDLGQVQNNASPVIIVLTRFYGRSKGETADDLAMLQFAQIRFACMAIADPVANYSDVISATIDKAFRLMMEFFARFKKDQQDDDCGPLRGLQLENASWDEIPEQPFLVEHYGWDLSLPFKSDFPEYDPDRWTG